jgi:hypothetical protein
MADRSKKFDKTRFSAWLRENGHRILPGIGRGEVLRFEGGENVGVVTVDSRGQYHFSEIAAIAFDFFEAGMPYAATIRTPYKKHPGGLYDKLRERDGPDCFYCGLPLAGGLTTIEHLLSRHHGGSDHLANLVLAHEPCNQEAGHLSVIKKIELRDRKRGIVPIDMRQGTEYTLIVSEDLSVPDPEDLLASPFHSE